MQLKERSHLMSLVLITSAVYNFLKHVANYMDKSIDPCDNFYRHVCRRDVPNEGSLISAVHEMARNWTQKGEEITKSKWPWTRFEKWFYAVGENEELFELILKAAKETKKREYFFTMLSVNLLKLKNFMAFRGERNSIANDQLVRELLARTKQELQESEHYPEEYKQKLLAKLKNMKYLTEETEHTSIDLLVRTINEANRIWEKNPTWNDMKFDSFGELATNLEEIFSERSVLTELFSSYVAGNRYLFLQVFTAEELDAANGGDHVMIGDTLWLAAINSTDDSLYGTIGAVVGHELFHSFQAKSFWSEDKYLAKSGKCIADHMSQVCEHFEETSCNSSVATFAEDGSDVEGLQLAYKVFAKKVGKKLTEPFGNTGLTHQQMFFVSYGTLWCFPKGPKADQDPDDDHSAKYVRVNGATSLMKAFQDAFQCKSGDRMFDIAANKEDCNTFGKPVRKRHAKN